MVAASKALLPLALSLLRGQSCLAASCADDGTCEAAVDEGALLQTVREHAFKSNITDHDGENPDVLLAFNAGQLAMSMQSANNNILSKCMRIDNCRSIFFMTFLHPSVPQRALDKNGGWGVLTYAGMWYQHAPQGENISPYDAWAEGFTQLKNPMWPSKEVYVGELRKALQIAADERAKCSGSNGATCSVRPHVGGYERPAMVGTRPGPVTQAQCNDPTLDLRGRWANGRCEWDPQGVWKEHTEVRVVFQGVFTGAGPPKEFVQAGPDAFNIPKRDKAAHQKWQDGPIWEGLKWTQQLHSKPFMAVVFDLFDQPQKPSQAVINAQVMKTEQRFGLKDAVLRENICCMVAAGDIGGKGDARKYPIFYKWYLSYNAAAGRRNRVGQCLRNNQKCVPGLTQFDFLEPSNDFVQCSQKQCEYDACKVDACNAMCGPLNAQTCLTQCDKIAKSSGACQMLKNMALVQTNLLEPQTILSNPHHEEEVHKGVSELQATAAGRGAQEVAEGVDFFGPYERCIKLCGSGSNEETMPCRKGCAEEHVAHLEKISAEVR